MSIVHNSSVALDAAVVPPTSTKKVMQRIAEVRREQGVSLRSVSRQMGKTVSVVRAEEDESNDLSISDLMKWQEILGVPLQICWLSQGQHFRNRSWNGPAWYES